MTTFELANTAASDDVRTFECPRATVRRLVPAMLAAAASVLIIGTTYAFGVLGASDSPVSSVSPTRQVPPTTGTGPEACARGPFVIRVEGNEVTLSFAVRK